MKKKEIEARSRSHLAAREWGWEYVDSYDRPYYSYRLYRKDIPDGVAWLEIPDGQRAITMRDNTVSISLSRREWLTWGKHWGEELLRLREMNFKVPRSKSR